MPFITSLIGGIAAAASTAASGVGIYEQNKQQNLQQQGLQTQEDIAKQQMADKQKTYDQANAFYTPYTKSGSPFLAQQQSQSAGQNAQAGNSAAGTFRSEMGSSGLGFGPSGATAAGLASMGAQNSATGQSNYLQNLLQNEQIKFQAQQGLINAGTMAGSGQNQPNVSTQLQPASTTGAIGAAGQTLAGAIPPKTPTTSFSNQFTSMAPAESVLTPPGTQGTEFFSGGI